MEPAVSTTVDKILAIRKELSKRMKKKAKTEHKEEITKAINILTKTIKQGYVVPESKLDIFDFLQFNKTIVFPGFDANFDDIRDPSGLVWHGGSENGATFIYFESENSHLRIPCDVHEIWVPVTWKAKGYKMEEMGSSWIGDDRGQDVEHVFRTHLHEEHKSLPIWVSFNVEHYETCIASNFECNGHLKDSDVDWEEQIGTGLGLCYYAVLHLEAE